MKDNATMPLREVINKLLQKKWQIAIVTGVFTVIGLIYVMSIPRKYSASITIVDEGKPSKSNPLGMLGGLGLSPSNFSSDNGITLELAPRIIESKPFLLEFKNMTVSVVDNPSVQLTLNDYLSKHQRLPWWKFSFDSEAKVVDVKHHNNYKIEESDIDFISSVKNMFTIIKDKKTDVYEISVISQDPLVSVILADSLARKIQEYLTVYQTQKSVQELVQGEQIAEAAKQRYYESQDAYTLAADKNINLTREIAKAKVERLENDMNVAFQTYSTAAQQVEMSRIKVLENTPVFTVIDPPYLEDSPVYPNRKLFAIVSFVLGLFIGVGSVIMGDIKRLIFSVDDESSSNN